MLTNPSKLSILGKNVTFFNYSLNTYLHSKCILDIDETKKFSDKLLNIGEFLFSQCNVAIGLGCFWEQ